MRPLDVLPEVAHGQDPQVCPTELPQPRLGCTHMASGAYKMYTFNTHTKKYAFRRFEQKRNKQHRGISQLLLQDCKVLKFPVALK